MKDFDFNLLKVLNSLMITHSVTRTSIDMSMSPGAISHALNRLREKFSDQLFVRGKNKLIPTQLALKLHPQIEDTINKIEQIYNIGIKKEHFCSYNKKIRIRCFDTIELGLILPVQKYISDENVFFDISANYYGMQDFNLTELQQRKFDILLDTQPTSNRSFISHHLTTIEQCLICREGHPRVSGRISEDQFLEEQFVSNLSVSELSSILQSPNIAISHSTPYLLNRYTLVATSDYLSFSSLTIAKYFKNILPLQILDYTLGITPVNIHMIYHHSLINDPTINFILNTFKEYISNVKLDLMK